MFGIKLKKGKLPHKEVGYINVKKKRMRKIEITVLLFTLLMY